MVIMINFSKPNNSSIFKSFSTCISRVTLRLDQLKSSEIAPYLFNITFNNKKGFKTNAVEFYKGLDGV